MSIGVFVSCSAASFLYGIPNLSKHNNCLFVYDKRMESNYRLFGVLKRQRLVAMVNCIGQLSGGKRENPAVRCAVYHALGPIDVSLCRFVQGLIDHTYTLRNSSALAAKGCEQAITDSVSGSFIFPP